MSLRADLLRKAKEVIEEINLPFKINKEKKQLEIWILTKEERIASMEQKIQELKTSKELNIDTLLSNVDSLDLEKRKLKQGTDLLKELYSE